MPEVVEENLPKDRRFNPSRVPTSPRAQALVDEVRKQLLNYEGHREPRTRQRRAGDQARFGRIVSAIVCELVHAAIGNPEAWRYLSLSKRMSPVEATGADFMTAERVRIIEWMTAPEMDWLEVRKGTRGHFGTSRQTAIRATARLRQYMDDHDLQYEDLGRDANFLGDPLVMRGVKQRGRAKNLPVPDGEAAASYRDEMLRINRWLAGIDISCDYDREGNPRDGGERWLRRIFNDGQLDQGGRLYGGFWQAMKGEDRLRDLRLNGEPVASLDYGQCGIRIAYSLAGVKPPPGDLYAVPGLEGCREGVKKLLNIQLARTNSMKRMPPNTRKYFGQRLRAREIEALILQHHHSIRKQFQTGVGLTLQFIESTVLVRCLLQLIDQGLVALPVHDALFVPQSQIASVVTVMKDCFKQITGAEAMVSVEGPSVGGLPLAQPQVCSVDTLAREDVVGDGGGTPPSVTHVSTFGSPLEGRISGAVAEAVE